VPYNLTRHPFPRAERRLILGARTVLATAGSGGAQRDVYLRLRLVEQQPGELAGFLAPGGTDHVRVVVGAPDGGPVPVDDAGVVVAEGIARTETVVAHSVEEGWIDLDVLVHGAPGAETGIIGAWAARAPLGSPAVMVGPKGSVVLSGAPREAVLAADDSALPAVRRTLATLDPAVTGHLLLETRFDVGALGIVPPAGVRLSILTPDLQAPSAALAAALGGLPSASCSRAASSR